MYRTLFILLVLSISLQLSGQKHVKFLRQGNRDYKENTFEESELQYRKSLDNNPAYNDASFNLGDALYKQEKYEDAAKKFSALGENEINRGDRAGSFYNLGNALLKANRPAESIEAYKNSLRLEPDNMAAKYNLAYAQDMLQKQEQNKEQQNNQDNKSQDNQEKSDQQQDQDQNNEEQNSNDKQENSDQQKDQENQQEQQEQQQMSKEDAERLLQAIAGDEEAVQEKVKKAKAAKHRVKTLKNW